MTTAPPPQILIYQTVSLYASSGAFIVAARFGAKNGTRNASTSPSAANIKRPLPTILPPSSAFFSPIFCPSNIVIPMQRLLMRLVIVVIICEPVETAETSAEPANLPTTRRSTAPYIACKNRAIRTGPANFKRGATIFPSVKSIVFSIFIPICVYKT